MALATLTIELEDENGQALLPAPLCSRVQVEAQHVIGQVVKQRTAESPAPLVPQEQIQKLQAFAVHTDAAGRFLLGGQLTGGIDVAANSILVVWRTNLEYFLGANLQFKPATEGASATLTGWAGGTAEVAPDGSGYGEGGYGEGGFGA